MILELTKLPQVGLEDVQVSAVLYTFAEAMIGGLGIELFRNGIKQGLAQGGQPLMGSISAEFPDLPVGVTPTVGLWAAPPYPVQVGYGRSQGSKDSRPVWLRVPLYHYGREDG